MASYALAVACAAAFVASYLFGHGIDVATLICCGAKDRELILKAGQWWRLISAGFLHASILHLAVNLYALLKLGPLVEGLWGTRRFILLYGLSLVAGSALSLLATPAVSVGASGAIFGLFGALAILATWHRRLILPHARGRLLRSVLVILAANVVLGIAVPFIDNAAHAGGLVAGGVVALLFRPSPARGRARPLAEAAIRLASTATVLITIVSLAMAVRYAHATRWAMLAGAEMRTHSLEGGALRMSVPRDWSYEPPTGRGGVHQFVRPQVGVIALRVLPPGESRDLAAQAQDLRIQWAKEGREFLASRDLTINDQTGIELLFRFGRQGFTERDRVVLFPTWDGRTLQARFVCLESHYRVMELLFDKVLHSIQQGPPRPASGAAQRVWQRVIEHPDDPDACIALAALYAQEGRPGPAEQLLLTALRLRPGHADTHDRLAFFYATARPPYRKPQDAVRIARKAVALQGSNPRHHATLAIACEAAGDRPGALAAARRAAALAPDDATYADLVRKLER